MSSPPQAPSQTQTQPGQGLGEASQAPASPTHPPLQDPPPLHPEEQRILDFFRSGTVALGMYGLPIPEADEAEDKPKKRAKKRAGPFACSDRVALIDFIIDDPTPSSSSLPRKRGRPKRPRPQGIGGDGDDGQTGARKKSKKL